MEEQPGTQLRGRRFKGYKFRRQHPDDRLVPGFYCHSAELCIEADDGIRNDPYIPESDSNRTHI
jgi:very-short-patch-repair endonuclease